MQALFGTDSCSDDFVDITPEERAKQLDDLEKRLDKMENEIVEEERQMQLYEKQNNSNKRKWCSCKCLSTTDIKTDIPGRFQRVVYLMHYLWMFNSLTLIMNWIAMFIFNGFHGTSSHFIMTSLFVLIGIPGAYYGWYRRFFVAIANRSQTKFMIFNVNFIIHLIFIIVMSMGFVTLNSAGILLMIKEVVNSKKGITKILVIISTSMWCIDVISSMILFKKCFKINTLIQYAKLLKKDPKIDIIIQEEEVKK